MSTLMPKWKWWHNDDKTTMMTKTIITMTKWQWWLKRGQQWWHNDNDKPMMTKKDDKTTMTATTAARYHHCHLFTFIVIDILSSSCHHWIIVMELVTMSSCHWHHRHLIFFIVSSSKSYHHDLIINVILSSYLVFVILSLSSYCRYLLWPVSSVFPSFFIFRFLFIGLLFLSPPSSSPSPSPSNTFFLHRHNFFSSCIAEIRRSFDSNGLLRSEFALI